MLVGCGPGAGDATTEGGSADDYTPAAGLLMEYAPLGRATSDDTIRMTVEPATWDFRNADGPLVSYTWSLNDAGLNVDGVLLLPKRVGEGSTGEGVSVVADAAYEVWYGVFPDTVEVEVTGGTWAGTQVFALDVGPILLTMDGASWELVYYE